MDITDKFTQFREAARHLWNTYFQGQAESGEDWDLRDEFSNVYVALFNAIVKYELPESAQSIPHLWDGSNNPLPGYRIKGKNPKIAAMINRDIPASGYWDYPLKTIISAESDLRLLSIFDWGELGFRDMRYFRVRIISSSASDIAGRDALVEADNCRIIFEE